MQWPGPSTRSILYLVSTTALILAIAIPTIAAAPTAAPNASAAPSGAPERTKPERTKKAKPAASERGDKRSKAPEVEITLEGIVGSRTSADGGTEYTLTVGGTTLTLDAGPSWFYGDKHPLKPFVGKVVTVVGEQAKGSTEVEVHSIDGTVIRSAGKPAWAGGWKRVGRIHPGWTQEKWDRWQAKIAAKQARKAGSTSSTANEERARGN
jgi:hypothetical protein